MLKDAKKQESRERERHKKEGETERDTAVTASATAQAIVRTRIPPFLAHLPGYPAVHDLMDL